MESNVIERIEQILPTTESSILFRQKHLVPYFVDIFPEVVWDAYYITGNRITITGNFQFAMTVHNLPYNEDVVNQREELYYADYLEEMVKRNEIRPLIIFFDGKFIPWSKIKIVRDVSISYLLLADVDYKKIDTLRCMVFPFNIQYTENNESFDNNTIIFNNGLNSTELGNIGIKSNNPGMYIQVIETDEVFNKKKLDNFSDRYSTGKDNYCLAFKDGLLYDNFKIEVDDYGLFTIDDGIKGDYSKLSVVFFYCISTNINENSHMFKLVNRTDLSADERLTHKLDFSFDPNKLFDTNLDESLNKILSYNSKIMDTIYHETSTVETAEYSGLECIRLSRLGYIDFNENSRLYEIDNTTYLIRRRPMIFVNNLLYDNHRAILYQNHKIRVPIVNIKPADKVEILWFKEIVNDVYKHTQANIQNAEMVNDITTDEVIGELTDLLASDLEIYTSSAPDNAEIKMTSVDDLDRVQFKVDYDKILGGDNHVRFTINTDKKEYEGTIPLALVSKRQFRYFGFVANRTAFNFQLTPDFNYCLNKNQYFIFVNGRKITQNNFILISAAMKQPFDDIAIYLTLDYNPGDYIDVFYLPTLTSELAYAPRIPKNGMINLRKDKFRYGLSKDMYLMFLNGKKVFKEQIDDINSHKLHINTDLGSRNDMYLIEYIHSQRDLFSRFNIESEWDDIMNHLDSSKLRSLLGINNVKISDTEEDFDAWRIGDLEITSEIARDYWLSSRIYQDHHDYLYDYDEITLDGKDFYEAQINELLNAWPEYKRLHNTFDYDPDEDDLPDTSDYGIDIDDLDHTIDWDIIKQIIKNHNNIRLLLPYLNMDSKEINGRVITFSDVYTYLWGVNYFKLREYVDDNLKNITILMNALQIKYAYNDYENLDDDFRIDYINLKLQVMQNKNYIEEVKGLLNVDYDFYEACEQAIDNLVAIKDIYIALRLDIQEGADKYDINEDDINKRNYLIIKEYVDFNTINIKYLGDNLGIDIDYDVYSITDDYDTDCENLKNQVKKNTEAINNIRSNYLNGGI